MTDSHTLEPLHFTHISVSEMDNNCYLIYAGTSALLIDAADDAEKLLKLAEENNVRITHVVTTHRHWDHVRALPEVLERTGATHYASYLDAPALPAHVDVELHHGDTIEFAGHELEVSILRGHTPGGVAIAATIEDRIHLFVGDSLFPGGVGKTTTEGDFQRLFQDVYDRLFNRYPDTAVVHPGHGKPTTLGTERPELTTWWDRRW
ncbi:MBL fold metallo-hydrolase [Corynebacterium kutscheri]|nr:MBL fold metallo-hydrolase [Corynebacterium kutscheri]